MLTRLKVSGFKNLDDVEVYFGPLTCVAGPNGVGKSNLFDAILFLSGLAEHNLTEAASGVRKHGGIAGDWSSIFLRSGPLHGTTVRFEADLILPKEGTDDLGEPVQASTTFVRYTVEISRRGPDSPYRESGPLELVFEELVPLKLGNAEKLHLPFPHDNEWRRSALSGRHQTPFISTETKSSSEAYIQLHQDTRSGRLFRRLAARQPRTLLSTVQSGEYPTAVLVRREMQSWRLLHLESSAIGRADRFTAPTRMTVEGAHLPSTLHELALRASFLGHAPGSEAGRRAIFATVANRLAGLIDDVRDITVDRDEGQQTLTIRLTNRDGTVFPADALSDGTLRFLALAVLELDPRSGGLVCLEEPENGIHPQRIPAILDLLRGMGTDTSMPLDGDNPLRQIIIATHSPSMVLECDAADIVVAEPVDAPWPFGNPTAGRPARFVRLQLSCLADTWRAGITGQCVTGTGNLLPYLGPTARGDSLDTDTRARGRRVRDLENARPMRLRLISNG